MSILVLDSCHFVVLCIGAAVLALAIATIFLAGMGYYHKRQCAVRVRKLIEEARLKP